MGKPNTLTPKVAAKRSRNRDSPGMASSPGKDSDILISFDNKLLSFDTHLCLLEIMHKEFQALRESLELSQHQVQSLVEENALLRETVKSLMEEMTWLSEENKKTKEAVLDLQACSKGGPQPHSPHQAHALP